MAERFADDAVDVLLVEPGGAGRFCMRRPLAQTAGMVSAQLNVSQPEALTKLRAPALSQRRNLADAAAEVLTRRMRRRECRPRNRRPRACAGRGWRQPFASDG